MGLVLTHLSLVGFRSYGRFDLDPDPRLTVLVGPNAVGKTNIIEALQLLTEGESFRRPHWGECVKWGEPEAKLSLTAEGDARAVEIALTMTAAGRRSYVVNGNSKRRPSEVSGILPCVVFTPDDLRVVKDSADRRRAAIDGVGDQLSAAYRAVRADFERIVRQRNAALKDPLTDGESLASWTSRLVEVGGAFVAHRRRLFDRLAGTVSDAYARLTGDEELSAVYEPSWSRYGVPADEDPAAAMERALKDRGAEETARGVTLVGPHRDDVVFSINGREARSFASQGQQRTIALAWKLAEVKVITDIAGQAPILLLDDVMSELDEDRRMALASFVGEAAQTVITTTNLGYFDKALISRSRVVTLT